ncbi:hypothetical protein ACQP1G_20645 [Nocardia sp. CA-107356]|uniref:hypothetical protein n=1 Tax=Nocardia sp. CA-107356 TaxID=3239972 RepID=UPI003D92E5CC
MNAVDIEQERTGLLDMLAVLDYAIIGEERDFEDSDEEAREAHAMNKIRGARWYVQTRLHALDTVCLLKVQRATTNYGIEISRELVGVPEAKTYIADMRATGHTLTITEGGRDVFALSPSGGYTIELLFPEAAKR